VPTDPVRPPTEPAGQAIAGDSEELETSEWGLDWGDIAQIRHKLELTPTERLRAAQTLINTVHRIRARNAGRG